MQSSDIPVKLPIPFANAAGAGYIRQVPTASQIGVTNGAASLTDGYPPLNFQPVASGGVPPFGQDMNGILNQISAWCRWASAGGPILWDSAFSSAVGGYPRGALVAGTTMGAFWLCTVDNNTTNPNTGGAGWQSLFLGLAPIASPTFTGVPKAPTPTGLSNDTTVSTTGFLTSAFVARASLGGSGYQKFPGGLILQWATISIPGTGGTVWTYPISFTTLCFGVLGMCNQAAGTPGGPSSPLGANNVTTISAAFDFTSDTDAATVFVVAIGF